MVMVCRGYVHPLAEATTWPIVTLFPCLGHVLQDDGGIRQCLTNTKRIMWKAFWGNCGQKAMKKAPLKLKCDLLNRSCKSIFGYRCSRWPSQPTIAKEVDRLLIKMVAALIRTPRLPGETLAEYCQRRNKSASGHCRQLGRWSTYWFGRATQWDAHIERQHSLCWPILLRPFRDHLWRESHRALRNAQGTGLRLQRGRPCMRWEDGVEYALRHI